MVMPSGLSEAAQFFWEHAGWSYGRASGETPEDGRARCATALARAEQRMRDCGAYVEWVIDHLADTEPTDSYFVSGNPQWGAILRDIGGNVLASLWGIDFAEAYEITPEDDPYARVVAAELADEGIPEGC